MNKKLLIVAVIASSALLAGCSNSAEKEESKAAMDNLTNQVSELSSKVDKLADDHDAMEAATIAALAEAEMANDRIDAIAESYKK